MSSPVRNNAKKDETEEESFIKNDMLAIPSDKTHNPIIELPKEEGEDCNIHLIY